MVRNLRQKRSGSIRNRNWWRFVPLLPIGKRSAWATANVPRTKLAALEVISHREPTILNAPSGHGCKPCDGQPTILIVHAEYFTTSSGSGKYRSSAALSLSCLTRRLQRRSGATGIGPQRTRNPLKPPACSLPRRLEGLRAGCRLGWRGVFPCERQRRRYRGPAASS